MTRLNKFLSESGACSRREADELIAEGRVTINGVPAASVFDAYGEAGPRGRFGLQVHDVGEETTPREVRFWNLRIREMKKVE